jgi:NADH-quinone oxidoreductase subunit L
MPEIETLIWLIPALPLAAFVLVGLVGCRLRSLSHWPVVLAVAASCVLSVLLLVRVYAQVQHAHDPADDSVGHSAGRAAGEPLGFERTVTLWNWAVVPAAMTPSRMSAGRPLIDDLAHGRTVVTRDLNIDVTLRADPLTSIMLVLVTFVGSLVVIYSIGYMHGDPGYARFFAYLALFIFSMTMLVVSSNFLLLYVFWEAVGVSSYLLIGFWFQKPEASAAGMKAFLVNRVGDVGLALAIFVIWLNFGTLNFHDVASADDPQVVAVEGVLGQSRLARPGAYHVGGEGVAMALALLLMLAACGKSAQFPLHV